MVHGKNHRIPLIRHDYLHPRLPARTLLGKDKFAAGKILAILAQKECNLKREENLAVAILMQTIEITRPIFEEQRCWPVLTGAMAVFEKGREIFRVAGSRCAQLPSPIVGERRELGINIISELLHDRRQGIIEIFVFTSSEGIARHIDTGTKTPFIRKIASNLFTDLFRENALKARKTEFIEVGPNCLPIDFWFARRLLNSHDQFTGGSSRF